MVLGILGFLIGKTVNSPSFFGRVPVETDVNGDISVFSTGCLSPDASGLTYDWALKGIFIITTTVLFVLVLTAQNAPEALLQDAKMAALAGACIFQVFFVALPAVIAVANATLPRFLVQSSANFVIALVTIFTMFVPKVYDWKYRAWNLLPLTSGSQMSPDKHNFLVVSRPPPRGSSLQRLIAISEAWDPSSRSQIPQASRRPSTSNYQASKVDVGAEEESRADSPYVQDNDDSNSSYVTFSSPTGVNVASAGGTPSGNTSSRDILERLNDAPPRRIPGFVDSEQLSKAFAPQLASSGKNASDRNGGGPPTRRVLSNI